MAGILVHADKLLRPLKIGLAEIKNKHIPPELHDGFFFHAKELFNGGKKLRRQDGWTFEKGFSVADDLVELLLKYSVPVTWRRVQRGRNNLIFPEDTKIKPVVYEHLIAYLAAIMRAEGWIKNTLQPKFAA